MHFLNSQFQLDSPSSQGHKLLAAIKWKHPELGRLGRLSLPRSAQALQGWDKCSPVRQRLPMSWLEACGVAAEMVRRNFHSMAVLLLLMFDLYLRPCEIFSLRARDAAPPLPWGGAATRHWSFTIRAAEMGVSSKIGSFDDTVVLDRPDRLFLGKHIAILKNMTTHDEPLFGNVTATKFNKVFRECSTSLGLVLVPYQARHGGASGDRADKTRPLEEVRKRGRWSCEHSTRRYEKHGKLQGKLAALPMPLLKHLSYVTTNIDEILSGRLSVPLLLAA